MLIRLVLTKVQPFEKHQNKEVRAQKFPRTNVFFLNLPRRKAMILQKGKEKIGGHRLRFGENMPRNTLTLINRASLADTATVSSKPQNIAIGSLN